MKNTHINICEIDYEVVIDPRYGGGISDLRKKIIRVGGKNPKSIPNTLYHEAYECLLHERGHRYEKYENDNGGVVFVLTHSDFENLVADFIHINKQIGNILSYFP